MTAKATVETREIAPQTTALESWFPIPDLGLLAINTFVLGGAEPILVDTGVAPYREAFLKALSATVDLKKLRYIWISHADFDHVGNLEAVLKRAPKVEVVTTFLGSAKLALAGIAPERMRLIAPGEKLETADRTLHAAQPPYFDAPESLGFFDEKTRAAYVVDAFGALLEAPAEEARAIPFEQLETGLKTWAAIDAPWLKLCDERRFAAALSRVSDWDPSVLLTAHLPTARGMTDRLIGLALETVAEPVAA